MRLLLGLGLALAFVACGPAPTTPGPTNDGGSAALMPDFSLEDRNPASASYGQSVSVHAQQDAVSAWYFSHVS